MDAMFGGPGGPTHMVRAEGCRVRTAEGRELIDWTMALGAVALGYGHPAVVEAVQRAARDGAVGPLPPTLEVRVAERLAGVYPGAEQARFFKTGAEAVQAAVRIARTATGRERVVHCGYQGWLDGATRGRGVPDAVTRLWRETAFDDLAALEDALGGGPPAALVLEPVVERAPSAAWLETARRLTAERGVVLVFDEIKTAFRLARGGAAERWGVRPDLAVLGKAIGNGFPLAAVVGRADLMARLRDTWVSSTLATEFVSLAAANAVLDVWEKVDVSAHIERIGTLMTEQLEADCAAARLRVCGLPAMFFLQFEDEALERRFLLAAASRGVLIKRGAYNFPSLSHGDSEVTATLAAVRGALAEADA
jgi:glutamate-1-semialdehyde aminotransferase